jgi:hypothetical protein
MGVWLLEREMPHALCEALATPFRLKTKMREKFFVP